MLSCFYKGPIINLGNVIYFLTDKSGGKYYENWSKSGENNFEMCCDPCMCRTKLYIWLCSSLQQLEPSRAELRTKTIFTPHYPSNAVTYWIFYFPALFHVKMFSVLWCCIFVFVSNTIFSTMQK